MAEGERDDRLEATTGALWPSKRADPKLSTPGWSLWARPKDESGEQVRSFVRHVNHAKRLSRAPQVFLGLNAVDLLVVGPLCIEVGAANITDRGMDLQFSTSTRSCVWSAGASWAAFVPHSHGPRIECGVFRCGAGTPGFTLHQPPPADSHGMRGVVTTVQFDSPFAEAPRVLVALRGFRLSQAKQVRLRVSASDASAASFRLHVQTWEDSCLESVSVAWLAYDAKLENRVAGCRVESGSLPCMNTSPGYLLAQGTGPRDFVQSIKFGRVPFVDNPDVATFLTGLEVSVRADVRLKAVEKTRTRAGCDLVLGTWADTRVMGGDIAWLAVLDGRFSDRDDESAAAARALGQRDSTGRRFTTQALPPSAQKELPAQDTTMTGNECVICYERPKDTLLQPCNHIAVCGQCASMLNPNICPVCRTAIQAKLKVYFV